MADNDFRNTVETLFRGMDSFISSKTVVGDAIHVGAVQAQEKFVQRVLGELGVGEAGLGLR